MIVVDIARLYPVEQFKREMDEYARAVRQMQPLPGLDDACLPGEVEWKRSQRYTDGSIPLGPEYFSLLQKLAERYDVSFDEDG